MHCGLTGGRGLTCDCPPGGPADTSRWDGGWSRCALPLLPSTSWSEISAIISISYIVRCTLSISYIVRCTLSFSYRVRWQSMLLLYVQYTLAMLSSISKFTFLKIASSSVVFVSIRGFFSKPRTSKLGTEHMKSRAWWCISVSTWVKHLQTSIYESIQNLYHHDKLTSRGCPQKSGICVYSFFDVLIWKKKKLPQARLIRKLQFWFN